jgi:hypothetical protein
MIYIVVVAIVAGLCWWVDSRQWPAAWCSKNVRRGAAELIKDMDRLGCLVYHIDYDQMAIDEMATEIREAKVRRYLRTLQGTRKAL